MIKQALLDKGLTLRGDMAYEVELVEFENEEFNCLDTQEVLYLGFNEAEALDLYETSKADIKRLNEERGGLQEDGRFLGLRFTRYALESNGEYQPLDGDDYYGDYEEECEF